tara:strand:+ start:1814 stop:4567 length:2754 start_codon:yes stop_codon:yes gene_type:complete
MECHKCKQKILVSQQFCTYCGTKIEETALGHSLNSSSFEFALEELKSAVYTKSIIQKHVINNDFLASKVDSELTSRINLLKIKIVDSIDQIDIKKTYNRHNYFKNIVEEISKTESISLNESTLSELDYGLKKDSKITLKESSIPKSTIAVLLTFAVVLTVVSSFILLVTLWDDFGWVEKEIFIFIQISSLIVFGHFVFKRMNIYYSGLALITVGAFCTYLASGIIVYEFTTYGNEFIVPEIGISLDLNYIGWIILFIPPIFIWAGLSYLYKGRVLTLGTGLGIIIFSGLLIASVKSYDSHWGLFSASITAATLSYLSKYLVKIKLEQSSYFVFWGSQIIQGLLLVLAFFITVGEELNAYPIFAILMILTVNSIIVFFDRQIYLYRYGIILFPAAGIVVGLGESEILNVRWIGLIIASFSVMASTSFLLAIKYQYIRILEFKFPLLVGSVIFAMISPFLILFSGLPDWNSSDQLFLIYSLFIVTVPIWIVSKNILSLNKLNFQKIFFLISPGVIFGIAIILIFNFYELTKIQTTWTTFSAALISAGLFYLILKLFFKNEWGFLGACAALSLYSIIISGWDDWGNWDALMISSIYASISIIIAYLRLLKSLMLIGVFFLTISLGFFMGLMGFDLSERTIGWALQAFGLLWISYFINRIKILPAKKLKMFQEVFYYAAKRLSWITLFCAVFVLIVSFFSPEVFGEPWVLAVSIAMAILGAGYIGESFINQQERHYYLGTSILLIGWIIQAIDWELGQAQIYAIPVGLYFLIISYLERQKLIKENFEPELGKPFLNDQSLKGPTDLIATSSFLDVLTIAVMGGTMFIQSMTQNPEWVYALLLGIEGIAFIVWSGVVKSKTLLFGGIIIFVVNLLYQITSLLMTFGGAVAGISIGLIILISVLAVERFKDRIGRVVSYATKI